MVALLGVITLFAPSFRLGLQNTEEGLRIGREILPPPITGWHGWEYRLTKTFSSASSSFILFRSSDSSWGRRCNFFIASSSFSFCCSRNFFISSCCACSDRATDSAKPFSPGGVTNWTAGYRPISIFIPPWGISSTGSDFRGYRDTACQLYECKNSARSSPAFMAWTWSSHSCAPCSGSMWWETWYGRIATPSSIPSAVVTLSIIHPADSSAPARFSVALRASESKGTNSTSTCRPADGFSGSITDVGLPDASVMAQPGMIRGALQDGHIYQRLL